MNSRSWSSYGNIMLRRVNSQRPHASCTISGLPRGDLSSNWAQPSNDHRFTIDLNQRMEYMSRALSNAKSAGPVLSVEDAQLYHDLEEWMDVAQVQLELLQTIRTNIDLKETADVLNSTVYDITTVKISHESRWLISIVVSKLCGTAWIAWDHIGDSSYGQLPRPSSYWKYLGGTCRQDGGRSQVK